MEKWSWTVRFLFVIYLGFEIYLFCAIAVDIFPTLLSAFLESFRKKRNTSTSAMQDISRMAEFGMFTSLLNTLSIVKDKAVTAYLKTLCLLLQEALTWNIYTARNDEIGNAQIQLLNTIADDVVTYLKDSNSKSLRNARK